MEVQVSRGEVPALRWNKKNTNLDTLEFQQEKQLVFTLTAPHPRWHRLCPREPFLACDFSYRGKEELMSEHPASTAVQDIAKETYLSHPIQSTKSGAP